MLSYGENAEFLVTFYLDEDNVVYAPSEVEAEDLELSESKKTKGEGTIDDVDTTFKNLTDWQAQADKMKLKVIQGTSPKTGEFGKYYKAKDKSGNTRGEFFLLEQDEAPAKAVDDDGEELDEVRKRIAVNSKGRKRVKMQCPKGFKYDAQTHACVKIGGAELATHRKAMIRALNTRKAGGEALKKRAAIKTKKALKFRAAFGLGRKK